MAEPKPIFDFTPPTRSVQRIVLADDDPMWIARCSREEVKSLILHPYKWIMKLNDLDGDGKPDFKVELAPEFVMQVTLVDRPTKVSEEVADLLEEAKEDSLVTEEFIVQGISGTGTLLVLPPHVTAGANADGQWDEYWNGWQSDKTPMPVARLEHYGLGFGHMELSDKGMHPSERADRVAAFLMLGADARQKVPSKTAFVTEEKEIPYINRVLLKKPHSLKVDTLGSAARFTEDRDEIGQQFAFLSDAAISNVRFTFLGREKDFREDVDNLSRDAACDNLNGTLVEGLINVDGIMVKAYVPRQGSD